MTKQGIVSALVMVAVVGGAAGLWYRSVSLSRRDECGRQLSAFGYALKMYAADHKGVYPTNVASMAAYVPNPKLYVCPGGKRLAPAGAGQFTNWVDYIFIPWKDGPKRTPAQYPVMYDRRISHHGGKGVNVLWADGKVSWDEHAARLSKFAADFPKLKVPMPEVRE